MPGGSPSQAATTPSASSAADAEDVLGRLQKEAAASGAAAEEGEQLVRQTSIDLEELRVSTGNARELALMAGPPLDGARSHQFAWMWGDAGVGAWLHSVGHSIARRNPARWSAWMVQPACVVDLARKAGASERPVLLTVRGLEGILPFENAQQALAYLRQVGPPGDAGDEDSALSAAAACSTSLAENWISDGSLCRAFAGAGSSFLSAIRNPREFLGLSGVGLEGVSRSVKFASITGKILLQHTIDTRSVLRQGLSPSDQIEELSKVNKRYAEQALELILSLKGYYIKAAQTLTGAGQLPMEAEEAFSVLLDQCPKEPFEVIRGIVEEQLGCPLNSVFRDFDEEAVAAASIGQVHFATLLDGSRVAVKVQYPDVERYFQMDIKMVSFAMRLAGMGEKVKEVFATMQAQFAQEFDYTKEASVMRRIAENVLPVFGKHVSIPLPLDASHPFCKKLAVETLCTRKVLTMELLGGTPIREHTKELMEVFAQVNGTSVEELKRLMNAKDLSQIDTENKAVQKIMNMGEVSEGQSLMLRTALRLRNFSAGVLGGCMGCFCAGAAKPEWTQKKMSSPLNGPKLARLLYDVHGHEIFEDGLFNSDPHAGNVLVLPDGRLGLIDYGAVMQLTEAQRTAFAKLCIAISDEDDDAVAPAMWECGFKSKRSDPRLALLLGHMFFNRGPFPRDVNRLAPKVGMPQNPDLLTLDRYLRGGALDDIEEFPGHLVMLQRCCMVLSGIGMELGAGRLSSAGMLKRHAAKWLSGRAAGNAVNGSGLSNGVA
eukprot:TRINITY_DN14122_c0_g2_i2.p1 TRINITY_DN14122_c0_g2~~TRINITY_DN14122_c0_g2_i2.p1  ORF type:complete len:773 (+),score=219.67 TRINITY_DN14122_c0_g2_i2:182-2500(+)